jgi:hypothetical protein
VSDNLATGAVCSAKLSRDSSDVTSQLAYLNVVLFTQRLEPCRARLLHLLELHALHQLISGVSKRRYTTGITLDYLQNDPVVAALDR